MPEVEALPTADDLPAASAVADAEWTAAGLTGIRLAGPAWRGRPTRPFAWLALPDGPGPHPGVVLLHGGGGTAFAWWVQRWVSRGYAAIAPDTAGGLPAGGHAAHPRNPDGGAAGWGGFTQLDEPPHDQWPWQATAIALQAYRHLRSLPTVDAGRIACTGISWGGVLACWLAAGASGLAAVVPVYGCGHIGRGTDFPREAKQELGAETIARWAARWDPSHHLARARRFPLRASRASDSGRAGRCGRGHRNRPRNRPDRR